MPLALQRWALVLLVGCELAAPATPIQAPREPPARPATTAVTSKAPVTVTLTGPETPRAFEPLVLIARIERRVRVAVPIAVSILLPAGVTLLEGVRSLELAPNTAPDVRTLRFVVRADSMEVADLRLQVHARGRSFGLHAEPVYRFGRALPLTSIGRTRGGTNAELRVGTRSFGRSVDITPTPR